MTGISFRLCAALASIGSCKALNSSDKLKADYKTAGLKAHKRLFCSKVHVWIVSNALSAS
jgi:hypothetical protein